MVLKLKAHSINTDNSNVFKKVSLRKQATAHLKELRVLDLFAGENILWSHLKCDRYYGVEKIKGKGKNLNADNIRIIESLDLSGFNVIDVDSYGIPFNQLYKIFLNKTLADKTVIIYTLITNKMCGLNRYCLQTFNLSKMYKKCNVVINAKAKELFDAFLYENGVRELFYYTDSQSYYKEYGYFVINKSKM